MAGTEIYDLLRQDHQDVMNMFRRIMGGEAAMGGAGGMLKELSQSLKAHMEAEEKTFYAPLQGKQETREMISEAMKEHKQAQQMLTQVQGMSVSGSEFSMRTRELEQAITHHVQEEEGKVFTAARKVLDREQAMQIGEQFQQQKQRLMK